MDLLRCWLALHVHEPEAEGGGEEGPTASDVGGHRIQVYPFNSFFSSLRKRQSVPWARIFWGFDLIMPPSYRRSA
jgi:hypothetical protein